MLGLMLTAPNSPCAASVPFERCPPPVSRPERSCPRPRTGRKTRAVVGLGMPLGLLLAGATLITLSSQVKLPGLLALDSSRWPWRTAGAAQSNVLPRQRVHGRMVTGGDGPVGWASKLGFGWLFTPSTANVVRSWMSPPTLLALGTGQVGIQLGLGDHTTAVLS